MTMRPAREQAIPWTGASQVSVRARAMKSTINALSRPKLTHFSLTKKNCRFVLYTLNIRIITHYFRFFLLPASLPVFRRTLS